jgi:tetratricopeptide (TPR) repeat protein
MSSTTLIRDLRLTRSRILILALVAAVAGGGWYYYRTTGPEQRLRRAREALAQGDRHEAERWAAVLERAGYPDHARLIRGEAHLREARAAVDRAGGLERSERAWLLFGIVCDGAAGCGSLLGAPPSVWFHNPRSLPDVAARQALAQQRFRLEDRARAHLREALLELRRVQDEVLLVDRAILAGECFVRLKELGVPVPLREAVQLLTFAVERQPGHVEAHRWLAAIYLDLGAVRQAVTHLEAVGRLDPQDGRPYRLLGMVHRDYQKTEPAIVAYREALARQLEPHAAAEVVEELARLLIDTGRVPEALAVLDRCPEPFARSPAVLSLRGECLWRQSRDAEAIALVEAALREAPDLPAALLTRAKMHLERKQPHAAIPLLERAVQLDPHDHLSRHQLVEAYRLAGDHHRADEQRRLRDETQDLKNQLTKLSTLAIQQPWDDGVRCEIARVWLRMGRPAEARVWLQAALACNPSNSYALDLLAQLEGRRAAAERVSP